MKLKENSGITLVALIVTIIILIILAGISIGTLTGENGLINQSNNAKEQAEIAEETETVELAVTRAMRKDRYGNIDKENLDEELSESLGTKNYTSKEIEEGIAVTFTKSNRSYLVDIDGNVIEYIIREPEPEPEKSTTVAGLKTRLYGVIEIEFLNEKGYEIDVANEPILKDGMKAVYWAKDESGELDLENPANNTYEITSEDENFKEKNWYEYTAQIAGNDGKTSRWANAMTSDGSYYVWIPRYSYRIVYFNSQTNEDAYRAGTLTEEDALENGYILGYSDARGIVESSGKRPTNTVSTTSISVNDKYFRTHPAFDGNVDEGGWDSKLSGIWVMKYEASDETKSVPNTKCTWFASVSTMFNRSRNVYSKDGQLNTILNNHMMKNSEWGAVAYLTDSKYGRNGKAMSVNQCSDYRTGAGRGIGTNEIYNSNYVWSDITEEQKYNGVIGQLSSTTGNIYGIYDIAGCGVEYVMGFYQDENENIHIGTTSKNSGFNGYLEDGTEKTDGIEFPTEKKYYQLYQKTQTDGTDLGDALYETMNWSSCQYKFVNANLPVFTRSTYQSVAAGNREFTYSNMNGSGSGGFSFRVCLAIK